LFSFTDKESKQEKKSDETHNHTESTASCHEVLAQDMKNERAAGGKQRGGNGRFFRNQSVEERKMRVQRHFFPRVFVTKINRKKDEDGQRAR
jgi:hypothetical protein